MSDKIRVQVVEHEELILDRLVIVLATDDGLDVVGRATTAEEGYQLAGEQTPDVVLVGTTLPDAPGLTGAREFRRRFPSIAVIVVAAQATDDELTAAIRAGVAAYCGHDTAAAELAAVIRRCAGGASVITRQLLDRSLGPNLLGPPRRKAPGATPSPPAPAAPPAASTAAQPVLRGALGERMETVLPELSDLERRVLVMRFGLEDGRSRTLEEVAREFGVSPRRIRQVEAEALRKLRDLGRGRQPPTAGRPVRPRGPGPGSPPHQAARDPDDENPSR